MTDKATATQTALGIDYLAKDYQSFRRLMLDRLAASAPGAVTGHPAELGTVLVELLACAADSLSYYQDAVATEAYLGTARLRTSVRRHARLLDYLMHDGCNARTFAAIYVTSAADGQVLKGGTAILTRVEGQPAILFPPDVTALRSAGSQVFETLHDVQLHSAHNSIPLYAGSPLATLAIGATAATLSNADQNLALRVGDALIFEETTDEGGGPGDPLRRAVVRLTGVLPSVDAALGKHIVNISWGSADALSCEFVVSRTRAIGNIVLCDHGYTLPASEKITAGGRHVRPCLQNGPLTWRRMVMAVGRPQSFDPTGPAQSAIPRELSPGSLLEPVIALRDDVGRVYTPRRDLLASGPHASDFVVEVEGDGTPYLRFGDGVYGKSPEGQFLANYRIGNGQAGNVGAEALYHIVSDLPGLVRARNPLSACGGVDPEPLSEVRLHAPNHLHRQERAVTSLDYEAVLRGFPEVLSARVTRRWTGSWYTLLITVQRGGGLPVDAGFKARVRSFLENYRMVGHDLQIGGPVEVPLDLEISIQVGAGYWRATVLDAVKAALGSGITQGQGQGKQGFFHPDRQVLGRPLYLSQLVNCAMQIQGVSWVEVTRFQRENGASALADGILSFSEYEVPLVENIKNAPERGTLEILIGGGQ